MSSNIHFMYLSRSAIAASLAVLALLPLPVHAKNAGTPIADIVISNGKIFSSITSKPWSEALAIKDKKILAIGSTQDIKEYIGPSTEVIDAQKQLVIPGIIDAHVHLSNSIKDIIAFNCSSPNDASLDQLIVNVAACAKGRKPGEWVTVNAYSSRLIPQLTASDALQKLDAATPDNPVVIRSDSVHDRWVNSAALKLANITKQTTVADGTIGKDPSSGELNGLLIEWGAAGLVDTISPLGKFNSTDDSGLLEQGAVLLNSFGVTGWVEAMSSVESAAAYRKADESGNFHGRVGISILLDPNKVAPSELPALFKAASASDDAHLSTKFAKIFLDGTPVTQTASVLEPYLPNKEHGAHYHGEQKVSQDLLNQTVTALDALGVSVKMHVTGDGSVREALNAVMAARAANGNRGPTHTLAHAGHLAPEDIRRFATLNVAFEASPTMWFPGPIMDAMIAMLGKDRAENFWLFRTYMKNGALVAGGTDWKTIPGEYSDLWSGIEGMVTRRNPTGKFPGVLHPEEALDVATALQLYTINSARVLRVDDVAGSLEPGKSADVVILNQDIFTVNPDCISETAPLMTIFEGAVVYKNPKKDAPACS
ncbi:N-substituted formamide deformylase [Sphingobium sp. CECT 9361]|nr:N-substituted formamide deformylase [Sphingobium sp. CECT 9361]